HSAGFAAAVAGNPKLLVADEPVSMLDVSIRIGVLNLMSELREREGLSFLYITHDVASARYVADRVLVLYAGHLVAEGPAEDVLQRPKHPYTQLLLSAVPDPRAAPGTSDSAALRDSVSLSVYYGAEVDFSNSVVVALSQSGQTPDVVSYVEHARKRGALTIGVTNDADSELAGAAELTLLLHAGEERAVAASK